MAKARPLRDRDDGRCVNELTKQQASATKIVLVARLD